MIRTDCLNSRQECDFGSGEPNRVCKSDRVCENIYLVLQPGCNVHDSICHHKRLVVGWQIEPENMAHASRGSHVGIARYDGGQKLIGMLRSLHQGASFACVDQSYGYPR